MAGALAFMIVGKDEPIYELDMSSKREDIARASQFILHAALDMAELALWSNGACYLKVIDRHNEQMVSAYLTPGLLRLLLLHEARAEEPVRAFFADVHEALVKLLLLNPFYTPHARVTSRDFDARVRALARKHLGWRGE